MFTAYFMHIFLKGSFILNALKSIIPFTFFKENVSACQQSEVINKHPFLKISTITETGFKWVTKKNFLKILCILKSTFKSI